MVLPLNHPFCFGCSKVTMGFIQVQGARKRPTPGATADFIRFKPGMGMETLYFNLLDHPTWDIMNIYVYIYIYVCVCVCACASACACVCVWGMKFRSNVSWEWFFQPLGSSFVFTSAFLRLSKQHFCSILDKETPCLRPKPWQKSACWPSVVVSGISGPGRWSLNPYTTMGPLIFF